MALLFVRDELHRRAKSPPTLERWRRIRAVRGRGQQRRSLRPRRTGETTFCGSSRKPAAQGLAGHASWSNLWVDSLQLAALSKVSIRSPSFPHVLSGNLGLELDPR